MGKWNSPKVDETKWCLGTNMHGVFCSRLLVDQTWNENEKDIPKRKNPKYVSQNEVSISRLQTLRKMHFKSVLEVRQSRFSLCRVLSSTSKSLINLTHFQPTQFGLLCLLPGLARLVRRAQRAGHLRARRTRRFPWHW